MKTKQGKGKPALQHNAEEQSKRKMQVEIVIKGSADLIDGKTLLFDAELSKILALKNRVRILY